MTERSRRYATDRPRSERFESHGSESLRYFESRAESYASRYADRTPAGQALRERRRLVLGLLNGGSGDILDVGCGPAVMAQQLVERGWRFFGVDAAQGMAREAAPICRSLPGAHVGAAALPNLPFPDDRFDAVLCMGVIDRLPDPHSTLAELGRVLRPGGLLLVSFPNGASPAGRWRNNVFLPTLRLLRRLVGAFGIEASLPKLSSSPPLWRPRGAATAVERAVGPVERIAHFHYNVLLSPLDETFPRAAMRIAARLERLRNGRLRWLGIGFMVRATKATTVSTARASSGGRDR